MSYVFYFVMIYFLVLWIEKPFFIKSNILNIRKDQGEELETWLKGYNWGGHADHSLVANLPIYKFYSSVINILLELSRKMGGTYQDSLAFLRKSLQSDRQFEKKIGDTTKGVYFQMAVMMILTWGFILSALQIVDISVDHKKLFFIFLWQIAGVGSLPLLLKFLRLKYFKNIGQLWKILLVLKSLSKVPLSRSEILSIAGVQDLKFINQTHLEGIVSKLKEVCHKTLKFGTPIDEELNYLMEELRFVERWHYELFEKRLMVIKLTLLSVFFLPSYLAFIFLLLGSLSPLV